MKDALVWGLILLEKRDVKIAFEILLLKEFMLVLSINDNNKNNYFK